MDRPRICVSIIDKNIDKIKEVESLTDLYEVRIDLIGDGWRTLVKSLNKPWIACNRCKEEGGVWNRSEEERLDELFAALELGASVIDIELRTENLEEIISRIKESAECLISYHELNSTPSADEMKEIVKRQMKAGADICKVVTTANKFEDNIAVLQVVSAFPDNRVVSFAMGEKGMISRFLSPLVGGDFTYASIEEGKESASGQLTVGALRDSYGMVCK